MPNFIDLTGKVFGRLSVLERAENSKSKMTRWKCLCTCGNVITVQAVNLKTRHQSSCGCLRRDMGFTKTRTHGMRHTPEYYCGKNMRNRCLWVKCECWDDYGGRGIKICPEWVDSFENFYQDMGPKPEGMTLEREDVNGHYCKENCVWATKRTQAQNKRNNVLSWDKVNLLWTLSRDGFSVRDIAGKMGISENTVRRVLNKESWIKE